MIWPYQHLPSLFLLGRSKGKGGDDWYLIARVHFQTIDIPSLVIRVILSKLNHTKERFLAHLSIISIVLKFNDSINNDNDNYSN